MLGCSVLIPRTIGVRFLTERDISSLGVRTGGWVEVDVSAVVAAAVVALGFGQVLRTCSKEELAFIVSHLG